MKVSANNEPQLICPQCKTTIKLTESRAAPLIAKTCKQFEQQLAEKQPDFAKREAALRKAATTLKRDRETELVYQYLTGPLFHQRIVAIVEINRPGLIGGSNF